jgi:outer membrane protein OmpA-like peptidoglycan-associated protein
MKKFALFGPAAVLVATAVGCGSSTPPPELVDARAAYSRAQAGPAAQVNPAGLYEARQALGVAERKYEDDAKSAEARNLAYLAHRKVLKAEANARSSVAQRQEQQAKQMLSQIQANKLARAESQLDQAEGRIGDFQQKVQSQEQRLAAERQARAQADARAKEALDRLSSFAAVKDDQRGMVITVPGGVLFEVNKAELRAPAKERLNQIADALKNVEGREIKVIGHTDSSGAEDYNMELSEKRAKAVRDHLASRGVREDLIQSEGRGEEMPVASNDSPEGRANNRRVEIIVGEGGGQGGGTQGSTGGEGSERGAKAPGEQEPQQPQRLESPAQGDEGDEPEQAPTDER